MKNFFVLNLSFAVSFSFSFAIGAVPSTTQQNSEALSNIADLSWEIRGLSDTAFCHARSPAQEDKSGAPFDSALTLLNAMDLTQFKADHKGDVQIGWLLSVLSQVPEGKLTSGPFSEPINHLHIANQIIAGTDFFGLTAELQMEANAARIVRLSEIVEKFHPGGLTAWFNTSKDELLAGGVYAAYSFIEYKMLVAAYEKIRVDRNYASEKARIEESLQQAKRDYNTSRQQKVPRNLKAGVVADRVLGLRNRIKNIQELLANLKRKQSARYDKEKRRMSFRGDVILFATLATYWFLPIDENSEDHVYYKESPEKFFAELKRLTDENAALAQFHRSANGLRLVAGIQQIHQKLEFCKLIESNRNITKLLEPTTCQQLSTLHEAFQNLCRNENKSDVAAQACAVFNSKSNWDLAFQLYPNKLLDEQDQKSVSLHTAGLTKSVQTAFDQRLCKDSYNVDDLKFYLKHQKEITNKH